MSRVGGLPWWGSKHPHRNDGLGQWIAGRLPTDTMAYVEPYAGMLGVLMIRQPADLEIVNDLDERLVNWWRVVRDQGDDLIGMLHNTPYARAEFDVCKTAQWNLELSDLERAHALTVVLWQSTSEMTDWASSTAPLGWRRASRSRIIEAVGAVRSRLADVRLENRDALELIARHADRPSTLIYCDPPYRRSGRPLWDSRHYPAADDDDDRHSDRLQDLLLDAACQVAVSGNPGDYPALIAAGWTEHTHARQVTQPYVSGTRGEALVVNYTPPAGGGTLF